MRYSFEGYCLDVPRRMLTGPAGAVPLRPKVFDLLVYLVTHRDRVVTKDELFEALWPGVHVGDAALNTAVKAARQAIGDDGQAQRLIRTWHGRGYRFVAEASVGPEEDASASIAPSTGSEPRPPQRPSLGAGDDPPRAVPAPAAFPIGKEHKQVTVLDCCVVDAAGLAEALGAEAMDEIMGRFLTVAQRAVDRHGGTVTERSGEGVVALFGAPLAVEDHARRGVSAALDMLADLDAAFSAETRAPTFRAGVHSGPVVVGAIDGAPGQLFTAAGPTTSAARAMRSAAPTGRLRVSAAACAIVGAELVYEAGQAEPPTDTAAGGCVVRAISTPRGGVPRTGRRQLAPFVGRGRELEVLNDRLQRLTEEGGQAVCVTGEPGIGKSRLIDEFEHKASAAGVRFLRANCLSHTDASPFLVLATVLRALCGDERGGNLLAALRDRLHAIGRDTPAATALLGRLMGLPVEDDPLAGMSPGERRTEIFGLTCTLIARLAAAGPCVLAVEDLHWIDPSSDAWLADLALRLPGMQVLLLASCRPGYRADWLLRPSATQLALPPLLTADSMQLVRAVAPGGGMSAHTIDGIVARSQGNPFFLEELVWSTLGSGRTDNPVPSSVQAVLAARIDRLSPTPKALLQMASVVGRKVPVGLIASFDGLNAADREDGLAALQRAEFLFERQDRPERTLAFKHALTQEVAYGSLLAKPRRALHGRIARALERDHPTLVAEQPELLAGHLAASGDEDAAVGHWKRAGDQAVQRSADAEAVAHYTAALAGLAQRPPGDERDTLELEIQLKMGVSLLMVRGPGSDELGRAYRRARAIGDRVATEKQRFEIVWGQWVNSSHRVRQKEAQALAGELVATGERSGDPELLLQAHHAMWTTSHYIGVFPTALAHVAAGFDVAPTGTGRASTLVGGHDPLVCGHGTRAALLLLQGDTAQSDAEIALAIGRAESLGHAATLSNALLNALDRGLIGGDVPSVGEHAARLRALAIERRFAMARAEAEFCEAWCTFRAGERTRGLAGMETALAALTDIGEYMRRWYMVQLVAQATAECGRRREALALLQPLLDQIAGSEVGYWAEAEVHRLWATILLAGGADHAAEAERSLRLAVQIAEAQGALLWQRRAVDDLAELLRSRGEPGLANDLTARGTGPPAAG